MGLAQFIRRTPSARAILAGPLAVRRAWLNYREQPAVCVVRSLERMVTSDFQIRVPQFDGEFSIGPRSHIFHRLLLHRSYEPELVRLFLKYIKPDGDVIDVGANIGLFTVLAAKKLTTGRVLAAEPTSAACARLRQNLALNAVTDRVVVFNGLISDEEGGRSLNVIPGREEYSSMGPLVHSAIDGEVSVIETAASARLDDLVALHGLKPAIIKVDVEGAEGKVFAGAEGVLKTHRPVVISELSRPLLEQAGSSVESVLSIFERCNYDVHDPLDARAKAGQRDFGDIIAFPR